MTFLVELVSATGARLWDRTGTARIVNDESVISVGDRSLTEGSSGTESLALVVTLATPSAHKVEVSYATANGTATAPGDFSAMSGTYTFLPGQTSVTASVTVQGDGLDEPNETFGLRLANPTNAVLGDSLGVATIMDDD